MKPTYSEESAVTARSVRITGMPAALASCSTVSQPGLDHGRERDHVDFLRDEERSRLDLVFLFLLRIGEAQVDIAGRRGRLDGFGVRGAPLAFGADLAEPSTMRSSCSARALAAGTRQRRRSASETQVVGECHRCLPGCGHNARVSCSPRPPGSIDQSIDQRRAERRQVDFEFVARLQP